MVRSLDLQKIQYFYAFTFQLIIAIIKLSEIIDPTAPVCCEVCHLKIDANTVKNFKHFAILTASAAAFALAANTALAAVSNIAISNISEAASSDRLYSVEVAEKSDRNLSNSKGTLKEGSAI